MRAIPCLRRPASIAGAPSRRGSDITKRPARRPSTASATRTEPASSVGEVTAGSVRRAATKPAPPTITCCPSIVPTTPSPGNSVTSRGIGRVRPLSRAASTTACATGCLDAWSSAAARRRMSSGAMPEGLSMATMAGRPSVRVPVLSRIRVRMRAIASSGPAPLTSTPKCAARDRPATSATGTARIRGQGVATTSTATARIGSPVTHHAASAMVTVTARKPNDQRSASRAIGALDACACSTSRTIPA